MSKRRREEVVAGVDEASTFRILVATDTHVGYHEHDPVRGEDSFRTWDEVLNLAREHRVDFVLHAGDLFHENKPSRRTQLRTTQTIRKHCLGDAPVLVRLLSDAALNFPATQRVNYEDPNVNVALPIFIVHGNHDDPAGEGQHSAIDLLAASGLVNYYGRTDSFDAVSLYPVLLQKGHSRLALYGLGNMRDERLHRLFVQRRVHLIRPEDDADVFNLLSIHQNRAPRGPKNYIPGAAHRAGAIG